MRTDISFACIVAGKVTVGLVESSGSLPPSGQLKVTCGLSACTAGSAETSY